MADDIDLPEEEQPPVDPQPEPQEPTVERYALVEGGVVLNVTLWDGAAAYDLPEGQALVACGEEAVGPGWAWSEEGGFVAPPEPEPGRRLLPKSTVTARLIAADLQGVAHTALMSDPVAFARWYSPDWPNVYADDEALVEFLTAIGADVEAITAP